MIAMSNSFFSPNSENHCKFSGFMCFWKVYAKHTTTRCRPLTIIQEIE